MSEAENQKRKLKETGLFPDEHIESINEDLAGYLRKQKEEIDVAKKNLSDKVNLKKPFINWTVSN